MFAGELEVDGDLTVTGNIQNQTIDSLLQVIQDLQSQLNGLQVDNRLETRLYEVNIESLQLDDFNQYNLSLPDLVGFNGRFIINPYVSIPNNCSDYISVLCDGSGGNVSFNQYGTETNQTHLACSSINNIDNSPILTIVNSNDNCFNPTIELWITAQFPDPDAQLRKTGLQSNDKETVK